MDDNEDITGKGLDFMSQWQQHYYTWSTKSLSGNKVGLGIVAASDSSRDSLLMAGTEGAKSEPCRQEEKLIIERMNYSNELKGIIRTGSIPSTQGVDRRNNKFVHVFSTAVDDLNHPENYLCPLPFEKKWSGETELEPVFVSEKSYGVKERRAFVKKYNLESRLPELCYDIYHCLLTSEKPLVILYQTLNVEDFASFSREMMILIHYLIPEILRKEADYVSYVTEMSQEAHFLFSNHRIGKYAFSMGRDGNKRNYTLLEREFFEYLADSFMKEKEEFDKILSSIQEILTTLVDKRNQLEKCILTIMASYAGKQSQKEDFFISMERLMYWARKDASLLKPLKKCIEELDYQSMDEEQLYAYTKLMLTGAGGETKQMVFEQLNHMLNYFFEQDSDLFYRLIYYIRENHGKLYEELLEKNRQKNGFAQTVIFDSIDDITELEYAVKYHKSFLSDKTYEHYLINSAYALFRTAVKEEKQNIISSLAKAVNEELFVNLKKKEIEQVVTQAHTLDEYIEIVSKMDMHRLEQPILAFLYKKSILLLNEKRQLDPSLENELISFASYLYMEDDMKEEIAAYYKCNMEPYMKNMKQKDMIDVYFGTKTDGLQHSMILTDHVSELYHKVRNELFAKKYVELCQSGDGGFFVEDIEKLVRFVLNVTKNIDKKTGKAAITNTKQMILNTKRLDLLAKANRTLANYGAHPIHCPENLWAEVSLDTEEEFMKLYEQIDDFTLVRCENSEIYKKVKVLSRYADEYEGGLNEKVSYAWKKYEKKKGRKGIEMEENRFKKVIYYAIEDILSKSVWAVLLGFYGFLFVTIREEIGILISYNPSVIFLILLVLAYGICSVFGQSKRETPGAIIYVMGIAVLLMNWGLALDTIMGISVLYIVSFILSVAAKAFHYFYFIRQEEEDEDED